VKSSAKNSATHTHHALGNSHNRNWYTHISRPKIIALEKIPTSRFPTPIVSDETTPFVFGQANVIRFRREVEDFRDAFETKLARDYENEDEDLTIIACGPMVPEAMRAAYILKRECGYETRVINMHTLKPLDRDAVIRAARETGVVVTAEEHQVGALAWQVSHVITTAEELYGMPVITGAIGVQDRFGESGAPWELIKEFEVSAEHIARKATQLMSVRERKLEAALGRV